MNEKQIRFWADSMHSIVIYLVLAFISEGILHLGGGVLVFLAVVLIGLYAYAFSKLDNYLSPEEKKQRRKYEDWLDGQRGP